MELVTFEAEVVTFGEQKNVIQNYWYERALFAKYETGGSQKWILTQVRSSCVDRVVSGWKESLSDIENCLFFMLHCFVSLLAVTICQCAGRGKVPSEGPLLNMINLNQSFQ